MTRAEILDGAKACVCGDRDKQYGAPEDSFEFIARLWGAYLGDTTLSGHDVALMMALLKIARIAGGSGTRDSFIDLAGYAACGGECANV